MSKKDEINLKITQEQISGFLENLNHRMTKIESDVCWIKKIIWYIAGIISVGIGKLVIFGG